MHLTDHEVDAFAAGESQPDREAHVTACAECAARVEKSRVFDELLADHETWTIVDEIDTRQRSAALEELEEQIRKEDEEAERILGRLVGSPYSFLKAFLKIRKRRFRTGGVVRLLCRAAHEQCERDPLHARNLADAAVAIAAALPNDLYPASGVEHLRGLASKERANACRYLGDLDAALAALDTAETAFRHLLTPDLHLAALDFIRATVLAELGRHGDAMSFASRAGAAFARFGDLRRWAHAQLVVGSVFLYSENYQAAHQTFASLAEVGEALDDRELEARVQYNVALCEIELSRFDDAGMRLSEALSLFRKLNKPTEIVRTQWNLGRLTLLLGNVTEGVRRLSAMRDQALHLRMSDDAAKITLDLVKGLLLLGDIKPVPRLLAESVRYFADAGQPAAVVAAAAYLRQAAAAKSLTPGLVDLVRRFIARAERDADLAFVPPS